MHLTILYASEMNNHILVLHDYGKHFWIEHFICDPEPSGWAKIAMDVNGQIFKSKAHTYLTFFSNLPINLMITFFQATVMRCYAALSLKWCVV